MAAYQNKDAAANTILLYLKVIEVISNNLVQLVETTSHEQQFSTIYRDKRQIPVRMLRSKHIVSVSNCNLKFCSRLLLIFATFRCSKMLQRLKVAWNQLSATSKRLERDSIPFVHLVDQIITSHFREFQQISWSL